MRVWRFVVCKLCSGQPFSLHFLIHLTSSLTSPDITHLSPPFHTTHLIHLTQHLTYIHSSPSSHITPHIHIHLSSHSSFTTDPSPLISHHHTPLISFISRHSFHTIHLTHYSSPLISNHSSHTTHLTSLKHTKLSMWGYPVLLFFASGIQEGYVKMSVGFFWRSDLFVPFSADFKICQAFLTRFATIKH